jgi:hypothetical protein
VLNVTRIATSALSVRERTRAVPNFTRIAAGALSVRYSTPTHSRCVDRRKPPLHMRANIAASLFARQGEPRCSGASSPLAPIAAPEQRSAQARVGEPNEAESLLEVERVGGIRA